MSVEEVRYRPFRGLELAAVEVAADGAGKPPPDSPRLTIAELRIPMTVATLRRLRRGMQDVPSEPWSALSFLPEVTELTNVRAGRLETHLGVEANLGVERLTVEHPDREAGVSLRARGSNEDASPLDLDLHVDYDTRSVEGTLAVANLPFRRGFVQDGAAEAALSLTYADVGRSQIGGTVSFRDLSLDAPLLSPRIVGPTAAAYRFDAVVDDGVTVTEGTLRVGNVVLSLKPVVRPRPDSSVRDGDGLDWVHTLHAELAMDRTSVADIAAAIPAEVLGPLANVDLDGTLRWDFAVTVPVSEVGDLEWTSAAEVEDFAVTAIPEAVNPFILNDAFSYRLGGGSDEAGPVVRIPQAVQASMELMLEHTEHTKRQIERRRARAARPAAKPEPLPSPSSRVWADGNPSAPQSDPSYRFVRLEEMSPWVIRAVLTAEDGDFFFHDGVNYLTLIDAIERNLREGEVVLGASTITMQLAKMLFLDGERTLARKLQEVFLVYLMEQVVPVPKERILELYINIAELGPGIYGVAEAADYYFAKEPGELSAGEATWLASILPSPKRYHGYFEAGEISPGWFIRMQSYFDIMLERGRMTEEEHAAASEAPPAFAGGR